MRPVAVIDRPVVVGADDRRVVIDALLPDRRQVRRIVVHHGGRDASLLHPTRILELVERAFRAGREVMPQPQVVPHLVGDDHADVGVDERPAVEGSLRRLQGAERQLAEVSLPGGPGGVGAEARVVTVEPRVRLLGRRPGGIDDRIELGRAAAGEAGVEVDGGVQDLSGQRVGPEQRDRKRHPGRPPHNVVAHVPDVPIGIVRHLLDDDGVLDADPLERGVPHQEPLPHRRAILLRDGVVDPEDNRLLRRR